MIRAGLVLLLAAAPAALAAQTPGCRSRDEYRALDFWLGEWDVFVGNRQVGTNRIEPILGGCAVLEHWTSAGGQAGTSLFYYSPLRGAWAQVWVTETPGAVKEKTAVADPPPGSIRFQGTVVTPDGMHVLDRTTLTPAADGTVRQVIEVSSDEGASWRTTFDARYVARRPR